MAYYGTYPVNMSLREYYQLPPQTHEAASMKVKETTRRIHKKKKATKEKKEKKLKKEKKEKKEKKPASALRMVRIKRQGPVPETKQAPIEQYGRVERRPGRDIQQPEPKKTR